MNSSEVRRRELPEPHEAHAGIPRYVIALIAAFVLWGAYYLATAPIERDLRVPEMGEAVDGGQLFASNCAACHQPTGSGLSGVFPPLAGADWVNGDPQVLVQILLHGITGELKVNGAVYSGAMPAFGSQLNDAQIAAVVSYVRSSWGNDAAPVQPSEVAHERNKTIARQAPWNGQLELETLTMDGG